MSKDIRDDKLVRRLLKAAHDHGYSIGRSMLNWDEQKSWLQFLKENNIPIQTRDEYNAELAKVAVELQKSGHSLRAIGAVIGLPHPYSVKKLIDGYSGLAIDKATLK